jgi:hypothetical protein
MEEKTYRCPNCGANITNTQNCEYCGSLLIRFFEKNIGINDSPIYTQTDEMLELLVNAFKKNIELQQSKQKWVTTKVKEAGSDKVLISVDTSRYLTDYFGDKKFFPDSPMSSIALKIQLKGIKNWYTLRNKFKKMKCFPLFSGYEDRDNGLVEYALDFGCDYESAAKICKEVILTLYSLSPNALIDCWTNEVDEKIYEERNKYQTKYSIFYCIGAVLFILYYISPLFRGKSMGIFLVLGFIMLIIAAVYQYKYMHKKE